LVPRSSTTLVVVWAWKTWVVSQRRVLEVVFILLEPPSPSRKFLSAPIHSRPLWFAVSVLQWGGTTLKTRFGNGHRSPLVTGNAPVTDQVLQISQER
jgi:hypothetical protein